MTATRETPLMAGNVPVFPRCETCEHWDAGYWSSDFGYCRAIDFKMWNGDEPRPAYLNDDAELATRRDFGCVLHEERDGT